MRRTGGAGASIFLLAASCTPTPSTTPLGWGPIAANMRADPPQVHRVEARRARPRPTAPAPSESTAAAPPTPATADSAAAAPGASGAPSNTTGGTPAVAASAFDGAFAGNDVTTYRLTGLPDREEPDPNAKINAKSTSDHSVDFVLVDSSNGQDICTLTGETHGNVATIAAGQKCFEQSGEDSSASATVTSGSATIDGSKLTFDLEMDFGMTLDDKAMSGTLGYHFEGTRQ